MTTAIKLLLSFALFCLPLTAHAQWDADAQDFFDRAEALDAEVFDLTASKPWANKQYVKAQWNDFVVGLKADNVWDDITEWVPLFGLNWVNSGALPKLKYDTTETTAYTSDFSAGVDGWFKHAGSPAGDSVAAGTASQDNIGPAGDKRDNCLQYNVSTTSGTHGVQSGNEISTGRYYRVSAEVFIPSGQNTDALDVRIVGNSATRTTAIDQWQTVEAVGVSTQPYLQWYPSDGGVANPYSGSPCVYYIRNVVVTELSPATVINSGFVTGDYDPIVGMTGDGTSYLDTGYWFPNFDGDDLHHGVAVEQPDSPSVASMFIGAFDTGTPGTWGIINSASTDLNFLSFSSDGQINNITPVAGNLLCSTRGVNDIEAYIDGASVGADSSRVTTSSGIISANLGILARNRDDATQDIFSDATLSHAHYGTGVTTAQALAISTRINTLEQSITAGQTMTVSGATSHKLAKRLPAPCIDYGFGGNHADRFTSNATVYTVSNLNASGAGSYAQAVSDANTDGTPSIINFSVSGQIDLGANISLMGGVFVDGTTAPDPGVCITNGMHFLQRTSFSTPSDNIIVQDVAFYPGTVSAGGIVDDFVEVDPVEGLWKSSNALWSRPNLFDQVVVGDHISGGTVLTAVASTPAVGEYWFDATNDELWVREGGAISTNPNDDAIIVRLLKSNMPNPFQLLDVENVCFIQCTFARATDITNLVDNCRNVAFVDCIFADALDYTYHPKGPHSKGPLFKVDFADDPLWAYNVLMYRNLVMNCKERNPARMADNTGFMINNVAYGAVAGPEIAHRDDEFTGAETSLIGNYLVEATNNPERIPDIVIEPADNGKVYIDATNYWGGQVRTLPWEEEDPPITNFMDHRNALSNSNSDVDAGDRLSAPHDQLPLGLTASTAAAAQTYVTTDKVGARWERATWQAEAFDGDVKIKCDWKHDGTPYVSYMEVLSNGTTLRLHFGESMTVGAGGNGGLTLLGVGPFTPTLTYSSGSGTSIWDYTISGGTIGSGEGGMAATYVQPGDGIETTTGGTDVQRWIRYPVNNNSTQ